jgi:hypothetical protein
MDLEVNSKWETNLKKEYLEWLFYYVLKQSATFELQYQNRKDEIMSKRVNLFKAIYENENDWWLSKYNARTILKNEILIDLDPFIDEPKEEFENRCNSTLTHLTKLFSNNTFGNDALMVSGHSGSRGYHISIFIHDWLFQFNNKNEEKRNEYRKYLLKALNADEQKWSERVTINLEYSRHWKTGNFKTINKLFLIGAKYKVAADKLKEIKNYYSKELKGVK